MKHQGAERGKRAGVKYAEAFVQHLGHGHPHANVIADALKRYVKFP